MPANRLYVGNLPYDRCTDLGLRDLFTNFNVTDTHVVMDRDTQRPRGFCFVTLASDDEAARAIEKLNGADCGGRDVTVKVAHDRPERATGGHQRNGNGRGRDRDRGNSRGRHRDWD